MDLQISYQLSETISGLGLLGGSFIYITFCKQTVEILTRCHILHGRIQRKEGMVQTPLENHKLLYVYLHILVHEQTLLKKQLDPSFDGGP